MRSRILMLLSLLALAAPQVALASSDSVIKDCSDNGKLDKKYSKSDLKKAKANLPSDINEYTDCSSVINRAISASGGGAGGGSSSPSPGPSANSASAGGGSTGASPAQSQSGSPGSGKGGSSGGSPKKGAPAVAPGVKPVVPVAGQSVTPGPNGLFKASDTANELPLPILLALIGIAVLTAAGSALVISRRGGFRATLRLIRR